MNEKLLEILKKAKEVDKRAKQYDSTDIQTLKTNVESRATTTPISEGSVPTNHTQQTKQVRNTVNVDSPEYKNRVLESKLPPEIQKVMLENPIQQPEVTDGFGVSEEAIKQLNPNYGKNVNTNTQPTIIREEVNTTNINEGQIRKIIAEELTKVLPSIVEKYFDNKVIKENTRLMKVLLKESRERK